MGSIERFGQRFTAVLGRIRPPSELERDGTFQSINEFLGKQREQAPVQSDLGPETTSSKIQKAVIIGLMIGLPYIGLLVVNQITDGAVQDGYHKISVERRLP